MKALSILSVVFALGAALFWGWSAMVNVPILKSGFGGLVSVMKDASTRLNFVAAACAAISALTQAVTLFRGKWLRRDETGL